jgi:4-amino-4-deoxy-L-arabinose transferase-like glycosyltransferase
MVGLLFPGRFCRMEWTGLVFSACKGLGTRFRGLLLRGSSTNAIVLLLLLLVALAVRVVWITDRSFVVENEGGEYAAIANNLLAGKGYIGGGEITGKPELFNPPLYPIAIAAVSLVSRDTEFAGRLVSLVMGLVLVIVLYKITALMYGQTSGLIAAALAAAHPLLVSLSAQVQTEVTYFGLAFLGAYLGVTARRMRNYALAGGVYGLAYLTRQEGLLLVGSLGAVAIIRGYIDRTGLTRSIASSAVAAAALFLVASPYVLYLHSQTGQLRLEYKSAINAVINENMAQGMETGQATTGVDSSLHEYGAYVGDVDSRIVQVAGKTSTIDQLKSLPPNILPQLKHLIGAARSSSFGGVLILVMGIAGFIIGPWTRTRFYMQAFLTLMLVGGTLSLFSLQYFQFRYAYFLLPALLIYCAHAVERMWASVPRVLARLGPLRHWSLATRPFATSAAGGILSAGIVGVVLVIAARANLNAPYDDWGSSRVGAILTKQAGLWLASQSPQDKVVMDAGSAIPFYADADYVALPYSSASVALRYIDAKAPDYVVVRSALSDQRPYLAEWAQNGIPGGEDRLVYDSGGSGAERIQIYRWRVSPTASSSTAQR